MLLSDTFSFQSLVAALHHFLLGDLLLQLKGLIDRFEFNIWKAIGLLGGLMFGLRWLIQAHASKKAGKLTVPALFWYLSLLGAGMQSAYFIFYRVDSVGVLATVPPAIIAAWNLKKFYAK